MNQENSLKYFLPIDKCISLQKGGELDGEEFEFSYFESLSGSIRTARTDKSDFTSKWDKGMYNLICPAVPIDWTSKKAKVEERKFEKKVIELNPELSLRDEYDWVSEEAIMLGAERFRPDEFLHHKICKEMWKLGIRPKTITGWGYYTMVSTAPTTARKKVVPIKALPLVDIEQTPKKVIAIGYYSEVYLKSDFPMITISNYSLERMEDFRVKSEILKAIENATPMLPMKVRRVMGSSFKDIILYYEEMHEAEIKPFFDKVNAIDPVDFPYENYLEDNNQRLILNISKFRVMRSSFNEKMRKTNQDE